MSRQWEHNVGREGRVDTVNPLMRRTFLGVASAVALHGAGGRKSTGKPALLGGDPVRRKAFPSWPRMYRAVYSDKQIAAWRERNHCPVNDQVGRESLWLSQPVMVAEKADMEDIALAMQKVRRHAGALKKAREA